MGKRLREIPEMLAFESQLLRIEAQVIGISEHLFKIKSRLFQQARAGKTLHIPESAHRKRSFPAREAIRGSHLRAVPVDEGVGDQVLLDPPERREPARVLGADEPE